MDSCFYNFTASTRTVRYFLSIYPSVFLALCLFPTFLAEGDGVVHDPADQSHEQPQQNEEDPVFPHPRDQELLAARRTHCGHGHKREEESRSSSWCEGRHVLESARLTGSSVVRQEVKERGEYEVTEEGLEWKDLGQGSQGNMGNSKCFT